MAPSGRGCPELPSGAPGEEWALLALAAQLLAVALAGGSLLGAAPVARLQVEAVLLDVLDDVFLLDLALEATKGVLDGLAFLDLDLRQTECTPQPPWPGPE